MRFACGREVKAPLPRKTKRIDVLARPGEIGGIYENRDEQVAASFRLIDENGWCIHEAQSRIPSHPNLGRRVNLVLIILTKNRPTRYRNGESLQHKRRAKSWFRLLAMEEDPLA